jgi:hypothetical protein
VKQKLISMKNLILIFAVALFSTNLLSQDITFFFQNLPDSSIMNLSKDIRKKIIICASESKPYQNEDNFYSIDVLDKKNGYLEMSGAFGGRFQLCFWNMKNGTKLIGTYLESCGPMCIISQFDFYVHNGKTYKLLNWADVMPEEVVSNFFKENYDENFQRLIENDILPMLSYELPRKGLNIVVKFGDGEPREILEEYAFIGNRMELIWNDGKFTKGKVYWSE